MKTQTEKPQKVLALSGGIGGAKLALGLKHILPPDNLTIVANTADDFEHFGLYISPDIDTLVYTLAGLNDTERGWGRAGETWTFMQSLGALGGETWFNLGDGDLAMHVLRTSRLAGGETLSSITSDMADRLAVGAEIVPMSNHPVRTLLDTTEGWLEFQDYFVARQAAPIVRELKYKGIDTAEPTPGLLQLIGSQDLAAIVICPSNPLISIEPILAVPGISEAIKDASAPVIAISPIINGGAVKGPTAKMLQELGYEASAATVLDRYGNLLDAYIADPRDMKSLEGVAPDVSIFAEDIMMVSIDDRERLARAVMQIADKLNSA
jgi:LPPG:FO 2-phospho-L-lactate transferase